MPNLERAIESRRQNIEKTRENLEQDRSSLEEQLTAAMQELHAAELAEEARRRRSHPGGEGQECRVPRVTRFDIPPGPSLLVKFGDRRASRRHQGIFTD